ncbi:MAG: hypothetical protein HQL95_09900 [Magnetococcales bacterium]|nr:hypothetical protein [Magnetococcales bacterium]
MAEKFMETISELIQDDYWRLEVAAYMYATNKYLYNLSDEELHKLQYVLFEDGYGSVHPTAALIANSLRNLALSNQRPPWFKKGSDGLYVHLQPFMMWCIREGFSPAIGMEKTLREEHHIFLPDEFGLRILRIKLQGYIDSYNPEKLSIKDLTEAEKRLAEVEKQIKAFGKEDRAENTHLVAKNPASPNDPWAFLPKGEHARINVLAMLRGAKITIAHRDSDCHYNGKLSAEAIAKQAIDLFEQWKEEIEKEPTQRTLAEWVRKWLKAGRPDPENKRV